MLILVSEFHLLEKRYLIISCWNVIQTSGWHTAKKGILKTELKIKKKKQTQIWKITNLFLS